MTDIDKEKIENYKKLIKEKGIKKATEEVKKAGVSYDEDFTESHRTDPIFSNLTPENFIRPILMPVNVDMLYYQARLDGNLYPIIHATSDKDSDKLPFANSILDLMQIILLSDEELDPIPTDSGFFAPVSPEQSSLTR